MLLLEAGGSEALTSASAPQFDPIEFLAARGAEMLKSRNAPLMGRTALAAMRQNTLRPEFGDNAASCGIGLVKRRRRRSERGNRLTTVRQHNATTLKRWRDWCARWGSNPGPQD
jgi:hypothetical protein